MSINLFWLHAGGCNLDVLCVEGAVIQGHVIRSFDPCLVCSVH